MAMIGVYITCDDAECLDCFAAHGGIEGWRARGGFEDWSEPLAIDNGDERDTPTHCHACGIVLEHTLTDDGLNYVAEYIGDGFQAGRQNPVTVMWIDAYGEDLDDATMPQADGAKLADAIACYLLLPRDESWSERPDLRMYARHAGWIGPSEGTMSNERYQARYRDGYYVVIDTQTGAVVPSDPGNYSRHRDGYLWDYAAAYAARDLNNAPSGRLE